MLGVRCKKLLDSPTTWFGGNLSSMSQDDLYDQAFRTFGVSLDRLARSYEADADKRRDLLQEIHFAIWRSLGNFHRQCSLRTWIYRVAHNVAASHVLKHRRINSRPFVGLEELENTPDINDPTSCLERQTTLGELYGLIRQLHALDREVVVLYLEGLNAASIAEVTGISSANVATKIHRIKKVLSQKFAEEKTP